MKARPCFNCGEAPITSKGDRTYRVRVEHMTPTCPYAFTAYHHSEDLAIAKWNEWIAEKENARIAEGARRAG